MTVDDILRIIALMLLGSAAVLVPYAIGLHPRPHRAVWLVFGLLALITAQIVRTVVRFHHHQLVWYGTPLSLIAGAALIIYAVHTLRITRHERSQHD